MRKERPGCTLSIVHFPSPGRCESLISSLAEHICFGGVDVDSTTQTV
jgi:hypothetical protein